MTGKFQTWLNWLNHRHLLKCLIHSAFIGDQGCYLITLVIQHLAWIENVRMTFYRNTPQGNHILGEPRDNQWKTDPRMDEKKTWSPQPRELKHQKKKKKKQKADNFQPHTKSRTGPALGQQRPRAHGAQGTEGEWVKPDMGVPTSARHQKEPSEERPPSAALYAPGLPMHAPAAAWHWKECIHMEEISNLDC